MTIHRVPQRLALLAAGLALAASASAARPPAPAAAPAMSARAPLARVIGLAPGQSESQAHRLLARKGVRIEATGENEAEERGERGLELETWKLSDPRYAWLQITFDARHRVRALQASLRADGPGLRYAEIGDLGNAKRLGYTIWEWQVPPREGRPGVRVTARGADSVFTSTVALAATE